MSRVAIITARGGSKRIPRKNIKDFHGKPVIAYAISVALESGLFDEVMVSTDDQETAEVAQNFGAKVPFMRSQEASNDTATTVEVLKEVLREYKKLGINFDELCCIYPVPPLIDQKDLKGAASLLSPKFDFVVPVARYSTPIQRALKIEKEALLMADPSQKNVRSQDLEPRFFDVGQFYFAKAEALLGTTSLFTERTTAFEVDALRVQDVDHEEDWKVLEFKYEFLNR